MTQVDDAATELSTFGIGTDSSTFGIGAKLSTFGIGRRLLENFYTANCIEKEKGSKYQCQIPYNGTKKVGPTRGNLLLYYSQA